MQLPTPCGGEMHQEHQHVKKHGSCYRPLAGVRCIMKNLLKMEKILQVTVPLRGELHLGTIQTLFVMLSYRPLAGVRCIFAFS